jgi:hypothetical protein
VSLSRDVRAADNEFRPLFVSYLEQSPARSSLCSGAETGFTRGTFLALVHFVKRLSYVAVGGVLALAYCAIVGKRGKTAFPRGLLPWREAKMAEKRRIIRMKPNNTGSAYLSSENERQPENDSEIVDAAVRYAFERYGEVLRKLADE